MAWIESHQEIGRHPKTKRFARMLGVSVPTAIGHLHLFWWWALDFASSGSLATFDDADIADATLWEGDPETLVRALVGAGWIDDNRAIWGWNDRERPFRIGRDIGFRSEMRRAWESIARRIRPLIFARDGYRCRQCGARHHPLEVDHIMPLAVGGTNDWSNLQTLCKPCNRRKGHQWLG